MGSKPPGILSSIYTYWLLISSLMLYIPTALINLSIQTLCGYKMLLQNKLKNIQNKIEKLESALRQKNKSMVEPERFFLGTEEPKQEKTWDDILYTEEEIHQYMQMPESKTSFNPETIFKTNEIVEENDEFINDGIDGMPFPEDDDFINDGIDGMPFPSSYEEYGNNHSQVKNKFSGLTKKLSLKKHKEINRKGKK